MNKRFGILGWLITAIMLYAPTAHAVIDSNNLLDNVLARYSAAASGWAAVITGAASWLFWTLVIISMVWTFGLLALRKADIGEFFAEFIRFIMFTGFFWWLLINGPGFASDIMDSLRQIGGNATGLGGGLSPSGIVDVGFGIFEQVVDRSSLWDPVDSAIGILIAGIILVILALIGVNMLLLLASGWILAYAGIFFLGFGGSRWTSDFAINYYKTVLGIAAQLLTMVLLVGIGNTFLNDYYNNISNDMPIKELGVMLIVAVILLTLVNKVPQLIAGIITGASIGGVGIGQYGAGAMVGAAGAAAAAATMAGAMIGATAAQAAGGASALMAAFSQANTNVSSGSDILSAFSGGGPGSGGGGGGGGQSPSSGTSAFAEAAGHNRNNTAASTSSPTGSSNSTGQSASGRGGSDQGTSAVRSSDPNPVSRAARVGADAAANLARGSYDAGRSAVGSFMDHVQARIADTPGGRVASAIRERGAEQTTPAFEGNSVSGSDSREVNREEEVAAFVNRGQSSTERSNA